MTLMLITDDAAIAAHAVASGVDRIFVDLEVHGKEERQGHLDTHRAVHTPGDLMAIRRVLPDADLLARVNPLYEDSAAEIDAVIAAGADRVMLPMFTTAEQVGAFLDLVGGRAGSTLLLETPQAMTRVDEVLEHSDRIDEIHIGLNDLHLGMKLDFMFELLGGGIVDFLAAKIKASGVRFGFGGIARIGEGAVPSELIIGEHVRLGSEMVILSRSFHNRAPSVEELRDGLDLSAEIRKVCDCEARFVASDSEALKANRLQLTERVRSAARQRRLTTDAPAR